MKKNKPNDKLEKWLLPIFSLPFLQPIEVWDCFVYSFIIGKPENNKINEFRDYLMANYIENTSTSLPSIWTNASSDTSFT